VAGAPPVMGMVAGLGGRDITAPKLADAVRRAVQDAVAGRADRPTEWIDLRLRTEA